MTGIDDLFDSFSQPDEFTQQAQLELFVWNRASSNAESARFHYWRTKFSEKRREEHRMASAVYKRLNPEKQRKWARESMARRYANDPAYRERRKEASRAYRAAKRAA